MELMWHHCNNSLLKLILNSNLIISLDLFLCNPIILKFCIEHEIDTAMLSAKFQNVQAIEIDVMGKWDFMRLELKMHFGGKSYIVKVPWSSCNPLFTNICRENINIYLHFISVMRDLGIISALAMGIL